MEDFLVSRSFIDTLELTAVLNYAAILLLEVGVCILLLDAKLARPVCIMTLGLSILGVFFQTPVPYGGWVCLVAVVTGMFANTKLGFSTNALLKSKADFILRNLIVWAILFALTYTLWAGFLTVSTAMQEPQTAQWEIWFVIPERNGIRLVFRGEDAPFDTRISSDDTSSLFLEGDCLEVTYYESPLASVEFFHVFQKHVTQIQPSNDCK